MAGMSFSLCSKANIDLTQNSQIFSGNFKDRIKDLTLSYLLGGGVSYQVDDVVLYVEANYAIGTKNILEPGIYQIRSGNRSVNSEVDSNDSVKINDLSVMTGVKIPISLL